MTNSTSLASPAPRVVIIGGGLAGLAAAEFLVGDAGPPACRVTLVEPAGRCGGVLGTGNPDGWLIE